ncbi:hypothetical protein C0J52_10081 [Blattella germanica]|nr:hypothetical protein C0J52_10081 [Blattella germanica]
MILSGVLSIQTFKSQTTFRKMTRPVLITLAAILTVTSSYVLKQPHIPNQNSATSTSENQSAGSIFSQNSYARDDSKIRHHSTTFTSNAANSRDVATAISEPAYFPEIEPIHPHSLIPTESLYPYLGFPSENNPFYSQSVDFFSPYMSSPVESSYLYADEHGNYPSNSPSSVPSIGLPAETIYSFYPAPHSNLYEAQPISYSIPSIGGPLHQFGNIFGETFTVPAVEVSPMEYVDTTILEAFYPELPIQTHVSTNNKLKTAFASANPKSARSDAVTDNNMISKNSFSILAPKKF